MTDVTFYIIDYPGSMKSAVYGAQEVLTMTRDLLQNKVNILARIISVDSSLPRKQYSNEIIFIPPATKDSYYLSPETKLLNWIKMKYKNGSVITSSCAGAFILANSGVITNQTITTHWGLEQQFKDRFPNINLETDYIVKDEDTIITSGGMMSWQDLVFHLIKRFISKDILNELGRHLIVDIPQRDQKNYAIFSPILNHQNSKVLKVQKHIKKNFPYEIKVSDLSGIVNLGERTFLRQFKEATTYTPLNYIQNIRIREAQKLLEATNHTTEEISFKVGYNDFSAFRKVFTKKTGLSPSKFRKKWRQTDNN